LGFGHINHAGKGVTYIGRFDGKIRGSLRRVQDALNDAKIDTKITKSIKSMIWGKLAVNAGINAIGAVTRLRNGKIVEDSRSHEIMKMAVAEAAKVAKRKRIKLDYDDPLQKAESVCRSTASNMSSMLQDVLKQRRTEVDYINGAVVRLGETLGIPTPVNKTLANLVKTIESAYDSRIEHK
jgi:2-dehydropantoate 2-reductase